MYYLSSDIVTIVVWCNVMEFKVYNKLPDEAKDLRIKIFVNEQGFCEEFDEADGGAIHIVLFDDGNPIGTCRIVKDEKENRIILGRICVSKECRGKNIGFNMLEFAADRIKEMGENEIYIHSQYQAKGFYEKCGYEAFGEIEYEQDCPHIWMKKSI